jgi:hypothetical protein
MAYHAMATASTALRRHDPAGKDRQGRVFHRRRRRRVPTLNIARFAAYIRISINNERR